MADKNFDPVTDRIDWLVRRLVTKTSGWTVAGVGLLMYPGLGLIMPLVLGWSTPHLVEANLVFTVLAAAISLGWLGIQIEAGHRRQLVEWTTDLRLLDSLEFEWLVGEIFRREGWTVSETGRLDGPDGNIDLELTDGTLRKVVQCKRWQSRPVGVDEIRLFLGTLMRESLPAVAGIFVTLSNFTTQARNEAEQAGLALVDNRELYSRIERVRRAEPCPQCGAPMKLSRSKYGWWLRCVGTGCNGKRDLGARAGRAVELLVESQ